MEAKIIEILRQVPEFQDFHISAVWPETYPEKPALIVFHSQTPRTHPDVEGDIDGKDYQIYIHIITRDASLREGIEARLDKIFANKVITIDGEEYMSTIESSINGIDEENGSLIFRRQLEVRMSTEVLV